MTQEERFAEFLTRADDVKRQLEIRSAESGPLLSLQLNAAIKAPVVSKAIHWLRMGAQTIADTVDGMAACRAGCDSCCHIPVLLLASEARVIGKAIGVKPEDVSRELRDGPPPSWRGKEHPCPFLKNSRCAIRESRPWRAAPCSTWIRMTTFVGMRKRPALCLILM